MNITSSDVILLAHSTFGVLGTMAAIWVFVEALNAREENAGRIRTAAWIAALCMAASDKLSENENARKMALCVAMLIVVSGLAIEGAGAIIKHGAKVALLHG